MNENLAELYRMVEEQCKHYDKYERVFNGQTWNYHVLPVVKNSVRFARERGADAEVVEVAALFHDWANLVDFEKYSEVHHIASGELAEPILIKYGYSQEFIDKVKRCIFSHRGREVKEKISIEEVCLADADAMVHIENVFEIIIWRGMRGDTVEQANNFVKSKLARSFAKLSDYAKESIKEKYEAALKIFY
ncbi:MAG: HD domain-containing protein [Alphaproteobacteria bacterium]|nr:HD domain-containing protein [Alphaproteobacteria bacterium]